MSSYLKKASSAVPKYTAHQMGTLLDVGVLSQHFAETFSSTDFALLPLSLTQEETIAADGLAGANERVIKELAEQTVRPGANPKKSVHVEYVAVQWPENMKGVDNRVGLYVQLPTGKYPNLFVGFKKPPGPNGSSTEILLPLRQMEFLILHWASLVPVIDAVKAELTEIGKTSVIAAEVATNLKRKAFQMPVAEASASSVVPVAQARLSHVPVQTLSRPAATPSNFAELQRIRAAQAAYDQAMHDQELVPQSPDLE